MDNSVVNRLSQQFKTLASTIENASQPIQPIMPPIMGLVQAMMDSFNQIGVELGMAERLAIMAGKGPGARNIRTDMMRAHFVKTGKPAAELPTFAYVPITSGPTDPAYNVMATGFSLDADFRRLWWPLHRLIQLDKFQLHNPDAIPGFELNHADKCLTVRHLQADGAFTSTVVFSCADDSLSNPDTDSRLVAHYEDNETFQAGGSLLSNRWLCEVLCPELYRQNELIEEIAPELTHESFFAYQAAFEARHPNYLEELREREALWRFNHYAHHYSTRFYDFELHAFATGEPVRVAVEVNLEKGADYKANEKRRIKVYIGKDYDPEGLLFGPYRYTNRGEKTLDELPVIYQQQILEQLPRAQERHIEDVYREAVPLKSES